MNIRISEKELRRLISESINEVMVDRFTPYSEEDRKRNFAGHSNPSNPEYEKFMKWREEQIRQGADPKMASYSEYRRMKGGFPPSWWSRPSLSEGFFGDAKNIAKGYWDNMWQNANPNMNIQ